MSEPLPSPIGCTVSLGVRFQEDHRLVDAHWERFVALRLVDPGVALGAFDEFRRALERHMAWEDDVLFPEFARCAGNHAGLLIEMLTWEHQGLRGYLSRIMANSQPTRWDAQVEAVAFAGMLAGHNRREESAVYPEIDRVLGPRLVADIASRTLG